MYVCVCNAVTDSEVRSCASEGARTLADLRERLGVATDCGRCARYARALLREHHDVNASERCSPLAVA
jgi:bacterioferritin-associated ferredoxin